MSDWQTVEFGAVAEFRNGVNFSQADEGLGVPIIKVKDFGDLHFAPETGLDELDPSKVKIPKSQYLNPGDIVIVRSNGNRELVGRSMIFGGLPHKVTFSGFCIRARIEENTALPAFIHYWLRSPLRRQTFSREGNGTGINNLSQAFLGKQKIQLPTLAEQNAISDVLSALDDKIELNRRMNETLEAMVQAIFKDWFVDFGPTRRKQAGATEPVAILGGLISDPEKAAAIAVLFPSNISDNGLPEGWKDKGLDEIAEFLNGLALQKYPPNGEDDLAVIKIAELRSGITAKTNRANRSIADKYLIKDGDFLFSWSGSLMAKFWTEGEGALNQHLFKVSSTTHPRWFYSQWVHLHLPEFQTIAASKATTMGHIQRGHLSAARVIVPPEPTLGAMTAIIEPLIERTIHNDLENRTLAETRDYLLPKLMSGEVRVRDAETLAG